jgi:hypothetical protein
MRFHEKTEFGQRSVAVKEQTKVIRFNQQELSTRPDMKEQQSSIFNLGSSEGDDDKRIRKENTENKDELFVNQMHNVVSEEMKDQPEKKKSRDLPVFLPKKFIPVSFEDGDSWKSPMTNDKVFSNTIIVVDH